ncbi:MAG: DUF1501 domain-containing protein [Bacteroidota bacterium]
MNRRNFLRSSGLLGLPFMASPLSAGMTNLLKQYVTPDSDRVLVLIQLSGGNDGLNTFIPLDHYATLMGLRENLMIPENELLDLTDDIALHPSMQGVQNLFNDGLIGAVQGVGYPNQNRSHFRSTDIWTSASAANEIITTGWLGRNFQADHPEFPDTYPNEDYPAPFAIAIGSQVSQTCQGVGVNFSMAINDPFNTTSLAVGGDTPVPETPYGDELRFLRTTIAQTNAYGGYIEDRVASGQSMVDYPATRLAADLQKVAYMISSGLETKVYVVNQGGYDTHAFQVVNGNPTTGIHADLLQTLSDAMAAFQADMDAQGLGERVLSMTFSEFGRRIRSNDSLGSDHGSAAPLILMGDCVMPGILGQNPEISPDADNQEGVAMQYDFRDVYGSVLKDWFGLATDEVNTVLGHEYTHLPVLRVCGEPSNTDELIADLQAKIYPNPFANEVAISFTSSGVYTDLAVYDIVGKRVRHIFSRDLAAGAHRFRLSLGDLPAGPYVLRLQAGVAVLSQRILKQ